MLLPVGAGLVGAGLFGAGRMLAWTGLWCVPSLGGPAHRRAQRGPLFFA